MIARDHLKNFLKLCFSAIFFFHFTVKLYQMLQTPYRVAHQDSCGISAANCCSYRTAIVSHQTLNFVYNDVVSAPSFYLILLMLSSRWILPPLPLRLSFRQFPHLALDLLSMMRKILRPLLKNLSLIFSPTITNVNRTNERKISTIYLSPIRSFFYF